ncbi:MAG: PQQ-binding-like beta-propeller repeat protein [Nocardiopsaceae bacterium]|nr:PQQ-binding-like beta-propeller repeat protein [Nocardiopsaceae bacterium]
MGNPVHRRRAVTAGVAVVVAFSVAACWNGGAGSGGSPAASGTHASGRTGTHQDTASGPGHGLAAAESGLLPWHLPRPLSREAVVPGQPGQFVILGGLTSGDASTADVYTVTTATGKVRGTGTLAAPVHDAAAAASGGQALVLGGGTPVTTSRVQSFPLRSLRSRPGGPGGPATGTTTGSLPAPRSDSQAATIGGTVYLVGGYDGSKPDATVLSTTDGRTFSTTATLPVPVRYPAVAAIGGRIMVFGGQAVTGPHAGAPVNVIQEVDPARHTATIAGTLPEPLAGAAAVTVGGELFVAGGKAPAAGQGTRTVSTIWAYDPASRKLLRAGQLQAPVSHAGVTVAGSSAWLAGGEAGGSPVNSVQMIRPNRKFGTAGAPGAGSPYFGGKLLVADRGNNRLLLLNAAGHIVWRYPSASSPRDPKRFYFPDDAFFTDHGTAIISNQEQNETIIKMAYPSGKIIWSYGHPGQPGTAPGYLHEPDDAYQLKNGQITVADAQNCRVLIINPNGTVARQIGTDGMCVHNPPSSMGSPNGDTPLADGNLLVSEINGSWVSEYTPTGKLAWTVQLHPVSYPSDPQQLGPDKYLLADYASPGQIVEFSRQGKILYRYHPASGLGELNHPSLVEMLPSGVFMANDDYNDRMVAIDPATGALVWHYGVTGKAGRGPRMLNTPDGFDLLLPNGTTPTHPATG